MCHSQSHHLQIFLIIDFIMAILQSSKWEILNRMTLISSSIWSFCRHAMPISSVTAFPNFLSATASVASTSLSTMFLLRNFESDLGSLPFIILEMHLKASEVLLNFWKSSNTSLNQTHFLQFFQWVCIIHVFPHTLHLLQLLWLVASEQGKSCGSLK